MAQGQPIGWNIFARELENILQVHKLRLGQLDDRGIVLHREKVRRLQQSLLSPSHFPTLNPEELDRLVRYLDLPEGEQNRLRAAIVATAVERTLMDRISPDVALMAANDVFELCLATMRNQPDLALAIGVKGSTTIYDGNSSGDGRLDEALTCIDEGTLYLFAARSATLSRTVDYNARKAQTAFADALALLDQIGTPPVGQSAYEIWHSAYSEAEYGYRMAAAMLKSDTSAAD